MTPTGLVYSALKIKMSTLDSGYARVADLIFNYIGN